MRRKYSKQRELFLFAGRRRTVMQMQEPEQWQANQQYGEYRAEYPGQEGPEQEQKIYPQEEQRVSGKALGILAIILSALGFFLTIAGIVADAIVLKFANGRPELLAGGLIGLLSSIGVLLMFVAIFVVAVITLARPT
jgi:hypothetical protein